MKRIALVLIGLIVGTAAFSQERLDLFGDEKRSFILLPAESVSSGYASDAQFSPTGRYITYAKFEISEFEAALATSIIDPRPPPRRPKWYRYDRTTKTSKLIPLPDTAQRTIVLGDERTVFFYGEGESSAQGFIDIPTGQITKTSFELSTITYFGEQPTAPYLLLANSQLQALLVKPNGDTVRFQLPPGVRIFRPLSANTSSMTFLAMTKGTPVKVGHVVYQISDGTSSFREITREAWSKEVQMDEPQPLFGQENGGDIMYVKLASLPKNLVTDLPTKAKLGFANCQPMFGPMNDCVVYEEANSLQIREIKPIDTNFVRKRQASDAKRKTISDAKQAATGLSVYAADNDGVLPGVEGWERKVAPYFKNADFLRDFNYTFGGGNLSLVEYPATTELGFLVGPGGRAVAYCDGHVKWIPNP